MGLSPIYMARHFARFIITKYQEISIKEQIGMVKCTGQGAADNTHNGTAFGVR